MTETKNKRKIIGSRNYCIFTCGLADGSVQNAYQNMRHMTDRKSSAATEFDGVFNIYLKILEPSREIQYQHCSMGSERN